MRHARTRVGDRYELTYPLGRGGMGEVWAGYDEKLDRPVAVKFLRQAAVPDGERDTAAKRFKREARITARLDHPGVPTVHDIGVHDDDLYIVMQLVPGLLVADIVAERGPLPVPWAAAIGAQVCSVLAAAHAASLIHRDLTPQNLILTPAGTVKVLDFGVAALIGPAEISRLTATGQTVGTPIYMAPEQALAGAVSPRTDLYALGCILFELLTGDPPYQADGVLALLHQHIHDPVPVVSDHRPGIPDGLVGLVTRLLAKDPHDRPKSATEVYELLIPYATAEPRPGEDLTPITIDRQAIDPVAPYRHPFGPLPQPNPLAPPRLATSSQTGMGAIIEPTSFTDLQLVKKRVRALAEEERFTQAVETLDHALRKAVKTYGEKPRQILELRLDLANMLMLAGAYRQARPEFTQLVDDFADQFGVDDDLARHCQQQAAICQAELGEALP